MRLVQASATDPQLQSRLRDTLNMARDTDKWKKLTRMLSERVSKGPCLRCSWCGVMCWSKRVVLQPCHVSPRAMLMC